MEANKDGKLVCQGIMADIPERTIILSGVLTEETEVTFQGAFEDMQKSGTKEEIVVVIKQGPGGSSGSSIFIHELLQCSIAPTKCIVENYACSAHLHIMQGAATRIMKKQAFVQFHRANMRFRGDRWYDVDEVGAYFVYLAEMNDKIYKMMQKRTEIPMHFLKALYKKAVRLSAEQALRFSLVDGIE